MSTEQEADKLIAEIEAQGYKREEIDEAINDKLKEFGTALSKAGAALLIQKELGLKKVAPKPVKKLEKKHEVKKVSERKAAKALKEEDEEEEESSESEKGDEKVEHHVGSDVEEMDFGEWMDKYAYHTFLSLTDASDEEYTMIITGDKVKISDSTFTNDDGSAKKTETIVVKVLETGEERDLTLRRKFGSVLREFIQQNGKAMPFRVKKKGTGKETSYTIKAVPDMAEAAKGKKKIPAKDD